ncbi:MAG: helix-turn-helix domain-containing protein [Candidatus Binatia bacterium]
MPRALRNDRIAPSASSASALAGLFADACEHDASLVSIPRAEIQLVVRFGPSARSGVDAHVFGVRERVHRKRIRAGQRTLTARLHLGATEAVFGVPASAIAGNIVALDELWGAAAARQLRDRLATARGTADEAAIVDGAIAERLHRAAPLRPHARLVLDAAARLASDHVNAVATGLGMSERHLRRVFRDAVGMSPKAFARLARFHRALGAAREPRPASWARIAAATGYYDQAHLIEDFRSIAGVTPRVLLGELASRSSAGLRAMNFENG